MAGNMSTYQYSALSDAHANIRLLRLLPATSPGAVIRVELFEYSLNKLKHSYEALSYVWGQPEPAQFISIDNKLFSITPNLHAALLQLRDDSFPRFLWIDAICINQKDKAEKAVQIQSMARIYAFAKRVTVYLGKKTQKSGQSMEAIRAAGLQPVYHCSKGTEEAVTSLLRHDWFQRIWVLQEVAAARHIVIVCGDTEIDGHAFCLGLENLKFDNSHVRPYSRTRPILFLIHGAIFRPKFLNDSKKAHQNACTLGELLSMYSTHKATLCHDKIFALLGMAFQNSPDEFEQHGLLPDYNIDWETLLHRLVRYILGRQVHIETQRKWGTIIISEKGYAWGSVSAVSTDGSQSQNIDIKWNEKISSSDKASATWTLRTSADAVREGDIIWHIEGTTHPMIIRQLELFFYIVMIEVPARISNESKLDSRNIALVWDWVSLPGKRVSHRLMEAANNWTTALVLLDSGQAERSDAIIAKLIDMDSRMTNDEETGSRLAPVPITANQMKDLLGLCSEMTAMQLLSWMSQKRMNISEAILVSIIRRQPERLLTQALYGRYGDIQLTEEVLVALISEQEESFLLDLLERNRNTIRLTERAMLEILRKKMDELMEAVLKMQRGSVTVNGRPVRATREVHPMVDQTTQTYTIRRRTDIIVEKTEQVLLMAVKKYFSPTLVRDLARGVDVGDAHLEAALSNCNTYRVSKTDQLETLLSCRKDRIISEKVLESAAKWTETQFGCLHMAMLLNVRSKTRQQITETVLLAIVENEEQPRELLQMLLVDRADDLDFPDGKVTSGLLEAGARNNGFALHIVTFLLDLDTDETHISEAVVTAAIENTRWKKQLIPLLCQRSSKARDIHLALTSLHSNVSDDLFTADSAVNSKSDFDIDTND